MMNIDTSYFIYHDLGYEENIITLTMAKKIFFEKYLLDSRGEKEAGQALEKQIIRTQQIKISYLDAEHKRIRCRLPYLGYERFVRRDEVKNTFNIYNQHGELFIQVEQYKLSSLIGLEELIRMDEQIPELIKVWKRIEPEVRKICKKRFIYYKERTISQTIASNQKAQQFFQILFNMNLQHYLDEWSDEIRLLDEVLSDFAKEGYPFPKSNNPCRNFELVQISYFAGHRVARAEIQYKNMKPIDCNKWLNAKRCCKLAAVVPKIYEKTRTIAYEILRKSRLRNINKKAIESLLENRMKELSLEYTTNLWQNYNGDNGIVLNIKCKKRRCLTFPIHYEYMDQFRKMMVELPQLVEEINKLQSIKQVCQLPFNATVSLYDKDIEWKKNK